MEDTGSPKKRKAATSSKSKDCRQSHVWMWQDILAKVQTPTQPLAPLLSGTQGENRMRKPMN